MANKNKLKPKGYLYISSPTLESLVLLCENTKEAAHISGIEYSNFLKACKMEKDIRFSTYRKCAAGLGKEVLVIHLPLGTIESMIEPKTHMNGFYETIEQDKLIKVLMAVMPSDGIKIFNFMEDFKRQPNKSRQRTSNETIFMALPLNVLNVNRMRLIHIHDKLTSN